MLPCFVAEALVRRQATVAVNSVSVATYSGLVVGGTMFLNYLGACMMWS
jgi:hypothetical protein